MINYCYTHHQVADFCKPTILSGVQCDTDFTRGEQCLICKAWAVYEGQCQNCRRFT